MLDISSTPNLVHTQKLFKDTIATERKFKDTELKIENEK